MKQASILILKICQSPSTESLPNPETLPNQDIRICVLRLYNKILYILIIGKKKRREKKIFYADNYHIACFE